VAIATLTLAWPLAKKEILARYRGSVVGLAWALLVPLAMLVVYAAVFQGVFKARWTGAPEGGSDYALRLFVGLIVFSGTTEVASRAVRLMQDHANLVKRVVFPLDLLSVALVMQTAVHAALQIVVLALLTLVLGDGARLSWLWAPLVWIWIFSLQLGLAWLFSGLGCYLRDLQHLLPPLFGGLIFLSPVFYARDAAPEALRLLLDLNPLTLPIECLRAAWFGGTIDAGSLALALPATLAFVVAARWVFERLRPGFADLL
jgi:lipopolysaccharide transport system permease protein